MATHRTYPKKAGFRLGIYVCKDAEIVDFAAPHGVFSVARRFDPELDAFIVAEALRPVQAQAGFTVLPNYGFNDAPDMDAFLIPGWVRRQNNQLATQLGAGPFLLLTP